MLRIPYIPTSYPDEMLASLLTRLMLYNGSGLWRDLLEETGYGRRTNSQFFGPPMQDARLDRLLGALGYTYPRMLRELTVLPFWLSFNQATNERSQVNVDAARGRVTKLTTLGHAHFLPGARYCPACLIGDASTYGEPYVHRHHQLPVANVCALHGVALRFACPACRTTVMPFNRVLLRPPPMHCQCGQDLTRIATSPPAHQQSLLRLSRFAADTLSCTEAPWTLEQVMAVMHERSGTMRQNFKRGSIQLMHDAYGLSNKRRSSGSTVLRWEDADLSLQLKLGAGPSELRAPEFCALLAAIGLSFDEFRQAASKVEVPAAPAKSTPPRPFTIEQARQELVRFEAESPGHAVDQLRKRSLRLFWLLRLRDSGILRAYGYRNPRAVPNIEADREMIEEVLLSSGRLRNKGTAKIRASIRDQAWLQARIQAHHAGSSTPQTPAQRVQQDRVAALSQAVLSVLLSKERPARVHAGLLAKFAQISMHQAQHTIAHTPALQALIAEANAGKDRRLAVWAARGLVEEGRRPSAQDVLLRAGLNTTRVNRQYCIDAIACSTADQAGDTNDLMHP